MGTLYTRCDARVATKRDVCAGQRTCRTHSASTATQDFAQLNSRPRRFAPCVTAGAPLLESMIYYNLIRASHFFWPPAQLAPRNRIAKTIRSDMRGPRRDLYVTVP